MYNLRIPNIFIGKNLNQINKIIEKEKKRRGFNKDSKYLNYSLEKLNDISVSGSHGLVGWSGHFTINCYSEKLEKQNEQKQIECDNMKKKWNEYFGTNEEECFCCADFVMIHPDVLDVKLDRTTMQFYFKHENVSEKEKTMCDVLNSYFKLLQELSNIHKEYVKNSDNFDDIICTSFRPDMGHNDDMFKYSTSVFYKEQNEDGTWSKTSYICQ